jgi:DNA-binding NarL/FixJ family response regulator
MVIEPPVLLYVSDRPVLSSLQFSLALDGFAVADGTEDGVEPTAAPAVVVDQEFSGNGLDFVERLRMSGCVAAVVVLATNPTRQLRARAAALGAALIEEPLLRNELSDALYAILQKREAA